MYHSLNDISAPLTGVNSDPDTDTVNWEKLASGDIPDSFVVIDQLPRNGDSLVFDSADGAWKPKSRLLKHEFVWVGGAAGESFQILPAEANIDDRALDLVIQCEDTTTNETQVSKILSLIDNNGLASWTEYAAIYSGAAPMFVYEIEVDGTSGRPFITAESTQAFGETRFFITYTRAYDA